MFRLPDPPPASGATIPWPARPWRAFRRWPMWLQVLAWIFLYPVLPVLWLLSVFVGRLTAEEWADPSRKASRDATVSLVSGIISIPGFLLIFPCIIPLVTGIQALRGSRRLDPARRGRGVVMGMAIAGLVLGVIGAALAIVYLVSVGYCYAHTPNQKCGF